MAEIDKLRQSLPVSPAVWLVTGAAGFIGSNLIEDLLRLNQEVVGLDNLATGSLHNLAQVKEIVGAERWGKFKWIEGDIRDLATCQRAARQADYILHQAALGSVPKSLENPIQTNESNVNGFVNMLWAARQAGVKRFVFASSSSVYGDDKTLPQVEHQIGRCLSPYAVSKRVDELYAEVFGQCYGVKTIGLRYFNVFGPRQDPNGPYAAVIPKWVSALLQNESVQINGDGSTSRDFCYIANVVQANLLAATTQNPEAIGHQFNIALSEETTLLALLEMLLRRLAPDHPHLRGFQPRHAPFRPGDVLHSRADISRAQRLLGYQPTHSVAQGLTEALDWYVENLSTQHLPASATV
ncbi:MAG: SDR family oxidoreductase [Limisphaerales bacterium]